MWVDVVALFLGVSLLFYCLLAGADFGAGMLEAFVGARKRGEQKAVIARAIGPVWEANHMWLILAIVILFMGFHRAYSTLSITFHIPLTLMLLGIILRGCAFAFRHYDAVRDRSHRYYAAIFILSSFLTPFMLGVIAGGMLLGRNAAPELGFFAAFLQPWMNVFSFSVGGFTCVLFAFLAAVYLLGETQEPEMRRIFMQRARICNGAAVVVGALVFLCAHLDGIELPRRFAVDLVCIGSMGGATLLLAPLWLAIRKGAVHMARVLAAAQVGLILLGWFRVQFPVILHAATGPITLYNAAAPEATLRVLCYALLAGSALIFPALAYLLWVFKTERPS
jgi:cytochrome d ubiquinol oxidase subunit II